MVIRVRSDGSSDSRKTGILSETTVLPEFSHMPRAREKKLLTLLATLVLNLGIFLNKNIQIYLFLKMFCIMRDGFYEARIILTTSCPLCYYRFSCSVFYTVNLMYVKESYYIQ